MSKYPSYKQILTSGGGGKGSEPKRGWLDEVAALPLGETGNPQEIMGLGVLTVENDGRRLTTSFAVHFPSCKRSQPQPNGSRGDGPKSEGPGLAVAFPPRGK
jgi:hypothetical protein